ncbi:MAG: AAA-like domain-containing protein [Chitinivibrionia bacterium]|nr:AAA-like domain-containing protein [Chitinivibrionia bacterium]
MSELFFNVAGPCVPGKHYIVDPLRGMNDELMDLINKEQYFVIHAARQSGKTTLLWELVDKLSNSGKYYALYCSLEALQSFPDPEKGIPEIVKAIKTCIETQELPSGFAGNADYSNTTGVLKSCLTRYCRSLDKPLIILFDEADCLNSNTLITFLRQLRDGYVSRPRVPFVHSVALVGMRNIRDFKAKVRDDNDTLGSASPFNIVKESLTISTFSKNDVMSLYSQHTAQKGQVFEEAAVDYIYDQTSGQPWLVNAIACECIEKICKNDYSVPITEEMVKTAINNLVRKRPTHFDSLMERLKEPRVRKIIQPLILGEDLPDRISDDYMYARDLGLIKETDDRAVEPGNKIYGEIIIRLLNYGVQETLITAREDDKLPKYIKNGKIDINFLIREFQDFWRENSEIWVKRYEEDLYQYVEAAPHLVFQAFVQRVINGGGEIHREMALGTKRSDICIEWEKQKYPIELKIYESEKTKTKAIEQVQMYMDKVGSKDGWIVVFDRSAEKTWEEKLYFEETTVGDKRIRIFGC